MKKISVFLLCVVSVIVLNTSCGVSSKLAFDGYEVKSSEVYSPAKGMTVYRYSFNSVFGAPQNISILEISPSKYRFEVVNHKSLRRTSEVAAESGAVAAVNGTFYNMKQGGSVCYLQIDGVISDTTKGSNMQLRANGAVVLKRGRLKVESWNQFKESKYRTNPGRKTSVMATMPLLILDGSAVELLEYKGFSNKRHPRTVIFKRGGKVYLMVIDGRHKGDAEGMTLDEVQKFLMSVNGGRGCKSAVNLDGGGSSTLWISEDLKAGLPAGVINCPSDNGKFDHKGERRVANSIAVFVK